MIKKWNTTDKNYREDYKIFKTFDVIRSSPDTNQIGEFYVVEPPNWVTIVPVITDENGNESFLLVKQYRHGSDSVTLEFPAGMVDPGEDASETAIRELSEETGYHSSFIKLVGEINPNPAFMTNITSTFVARDLVKSGKQNLDENEEIEIVIMPIEEFHKLIGEPMDKNPMVNSAITIQAYFFYLKSLSPDVFNFGQPS